MMTDHNPEDTSLGIYFFQLFEPFGGAGTTYLVAELKKRHWIGIEIGAVEDILERFQKIDREREYLTRIRENIIVYSRKKRYEKESDEDYGQAIP
ncbi:hypothetical protein V0288_04930 [Pannus brasiliensis CCIBt3594]|uniref:DNA methylase N-4/N-6 domain-containing protein n=1 Tax=Pannus brasiliensis CCIBt3594 TaxID=1427578 RepID=A0AAW9QFB9_9CHRO